MKFIAYLLISILLPGCAVTPSRTIDVEIYEELLAPNSQGDSRTKLFAVLIGESTPYAKVRISNFKIGKMQDLYIASKDVPALRTALQHIADSGSNDGARIIYNLKANGDNLSIYTAKDSTRFVISTNYVLWVFNTSEAKSLLSILDELEKASKPAK